MSQQNKPEVWLRGPLPGIPSLLQPVAHALLQANEEVGEIMTEFPDGLLWIRPAGMASAGFHLQHLTGVLSRLFTYAAGNQLRPEQLEYLKQEEAPLQPVSAAELVERFSRQVATALEQLKNTDENTLTDVRGVGRKQIPSTVAGLLFHAAEHTQRHVGQLLVTVNVVKHQELKDL